MFVKVLPTALQLVLLLVSPKLQAKIPKVPIGIGSILIPVSIAGFAW
jgi:hypothetical protein